MGRLGFDALRGRIDNYVDLRHRGRCIYCGRSLLGQKKSRDHVPTKAILDRPYPAALATIPSCVPCNNSFGSDEEQAANYFRMLPKLRSLRVDGSEIDIARIGRVCIKNARAHIFFETGEPHFDDPFESSFGPLAAWSEESVIDFLKGSGLTEVWCEVGSRWNTRVIEGDDFDEFGFLTVQPDVYRFRIEEGGRGVSMIIRESFLARIFWEH